MFNDLLEIIKGIFKKLFSSRLFILGGIPVLPFLRFWEYVCLIFRS